jgi:hypothetical protein
LGQKIFATIILFFRDCFHVIIISIYCIFFYTNIFTTILGDIAHNVPAVYDVASRL